MSVITSGMIQVKTGIHQKKGLFATLFTTNPTHTGLALNSGLHCERPVTNQLSCCSGNSPGTRLFLTECFIFGSPENTE
jgi:hypothetical protein